LVTADLLRRDADGRPSAAHDSERLAAALQRAMPPVRAEAGPGPT
jgi:hypothetical protein